MFGYLVSKFLLAWCTLFALAPPRPAHSSPSHRSYRLGYLLNELPLVAFYWLAASTVLALSEGAAHGWPGRIALGLAAATTAGLALVTWRGLRAREAVEAALAAGLGPRWRADLDTDLAARLRRRPRSPASSSRPSASGVAP